MQCCCYLITFRWETSASYATYRYSKLSMQGIFLKFSQHFYLALKDLTWKKWGSCRVSTLHIVRLVHMLTTYIYISLHDVYTRSPLRTLRSLDYRYRPSGLAQGWDHGWVRTNGRRTWQGSDGAWDGFKQENWWVLMDNSGENSYISINLDYF